MEFADSPSPTRTAGFTLVELMVAMSIALIVLGGVMSAFIQFSKVGLSLHAYFQMESDVRLMVETFGRDVRQAKEAHFSDPRTLQLRSETEVVTYFFDKKNRSFTRTLGNGVAFRLSDSVEALEFVPYDIAGQALDLSPASAGTSSLNDSVKMIQLRFRVLERTNLSHQASELAATARFMMRNKLLP
jgi:prepilin-type N-terminal cleavage/methylation domain-containing protein